MSAPSPAGTRPATGLVPHDRIAAMGGLAFLKALFAGELPVPPFSATTDVYGVEAEAGRVVFVGQPSENFSNPFGIVHGGWMSTIMDSALGCAVLSALGPGKGFTTIELKVNFVRPVTAATGEVRCVGTLVHQGGRILTSEAKLTDGRGRLLAHGTSTCMAIDIGAPQG
jgi:uncharacterized protein (TIGR00369 family)